MYNDVKLVTTMIIILRLQSLNAEHETCGIPANPKPWQFIAWGLLCEVSQTNPCVPADLTTMKEGRNDLQRGSFRVTFMGSK
jgi:hypothetical protein